MGRSRKGFQEGTLGHIPKFNDKLTRKIKGSKNGFHLVRSEKSLGSMTEEVTNSSLQHPT